MDISYQKFTPEKAIGKHLIVLHGNEIQLRNEIKDLLKQEINELADFKINVCLLYTSPSPRDLSTSRMPSSA